MISNLIINVKVSEYLLTEGSSKHAKQYDILAIE